MTMTPEENEMSRASEEVYSSLKQRFKGNLFRPSDAGYADASAIWNGMVARNPGIIARPEDVDDVRTAVRAASELDILTAIRCGGHSLAGFSTCEGGLVIDLSKMRKVTVDSTARRARFAGGCLLGTIDTATQKAGLVFPAGVVSHTGASGLILGGGTGWLTRRFGLSCDNVEGFSLVTADGALVWATSTENPELFWALRGGGGNFGVVTEFEVRLHPLTSVVLAEGLAPESDIRALLEFWREFMADAPIDLKWNIDLRLAPQSERVPAELRGQPVASMFFGLDWRSRGRVSVSGPRALPVYSRRCAQENSFVRRSTDDGGFRFSPRPTVLHQVWLFRFLERLQH